MNEKYPSKKEYISKLKNGDNTNLSHLLDLAMDIRNSKIELYLKRATCLWAFIFVFFVVYCQTIPETHCEGNIDAGWIANYAIIIGGYLFSLGLYFVNKVSKFWLKNWEKHIDILSQELHDPLFRLMGCNKYYTLNHEQSYLYYVFKINRFISLLICILWFGLIVLRTGSVGAAYTIITVIIAVILPVVFYLLANRFASKIEKSSKEFFDNYN